MPTCLITEDLWKTLTNRVRSSTRPCHVAVAYFGQGASKLLPLPEGSRLVVNASHAAVKAGQTCPDELIALQKKGVAIFSVENLHAKVFVIGKTAFVGSANTSRHSAERLVEAVLQTTEPTTVAQAKSFVNDLCLKNVGPEQLKELAKIYRPPIIAGRKIKAAKAGEKGASAQFGDLRIVRLGAGDYPEDELDLVEEGEKVAQRSRQHRDATHEVCSFRWEGRCHVKPGQQLIQVWEVSGKVWVYPPAFVLHVRRKDAKTAVHYLWVEYPIRRRINLERLAAMLGRGSKKKLLTEGKVKDTAFAEALMRIWNV